MQSFHRTNAIFIYQLKIHSKRDTAKATAVYVGLEGTCPGIENEDLSPFFREKWPQVWICIVSSVRSGGRR